MFVNRVTGDVIPASTNEQHEGKHKRVECIAS